MGFPELKSINECIACFDLASSNCDNVPSRNLGFATPGS